MSDEWEDIDVGYCAVCEYEYGSDDCRGCPLYECGSDVEDEEDEDCDC